MTIFGNFGPIAGQIGAVLGVKASFHPKWLNHNLTYLFWKLWHILVENHIKVIFWPFWIILAPAWAKRRHFVIKVNYHVKWLNPNLTHFFRKSHSTTGLKIMKKIFWLFLVIRADNGPNGAVLGIKASFHRKSFLKIMTHFGLKSYKSHILTVLDHFGPIKGQAAPFWELRPVSTPNGPIITWHIIFENYDTFWLKII